MLGILLTLSSLIPSKTSVVTERYADNFVMATQHENISEKDNYLIINESYVYGTNMKPEDKSLGDIISEEIEKYDWDIDTATAIAKCESGLNPMAINWKDALITGMPSMGIFQLNRPYDEKYFDWKYNIWEAYNLYLKRGWRPWTCTKMIKKYP